MSQISKQSIVLLKDSRPDSLFMDQIYDPDLDGEWTEDSAKIIPEPGASVFDRSPEAQGQLYYVASVDNRYKSTLLPARLVISEGQEVIKILSYGNDKFTLYYDDRVNPTKVMIDSKLVVFGTNLVEYKLSKTYADGKKEYISLYVENNDSYRGDRIPLTNVDGKTNTKILTNCHTLSDLEDGDVIDAEIYDSAGILSITVQLFVKRALILNDLLSATSIVTHFDASANQMKGEEFYVYMKQDPTHLGIVPRLTYSNGVTEDLVIDNKTCFMYGLDDFLPAYPGQRQKILLKKYLGLRQVSPDAVIDGTSKFITCEKWISVLSDNTVDNIKLSVIPIYNSGTFSYELKFIAYSDSRDRVRDLTKETHLLTPFDGTNYGAVQVLDISTTVLVDPDTEIPINHVQRVYISLKPGNEFQRYILSEDLESGIWYGVESTERRRPVVMYDSTLRQYFIPTSRFMNKASFLDAFYYLAGPLYNPNTELGPMEPTHFTIRDSNTLIPLLATPVPIEEYAQAMNFKTSSMSEYTEQTLIVEFLTNVGDVFQIIYGVPVDVKKSDTGYNTP